jgi:NADH:ubiquinone reductase (non-electrogenic)
VCILGGGFGGLYTALRLESLEWPDHKKPQVGILTFKFQTQFISFMCMDVDAKTVIGIGTCETV